ncbi:unnamed protein product [Strongylus vulgaris]|uniref:Uncharacterized protein n=1 Tax=Strongylus vulgaris TaxID=40348 RepID=A0A3P7LDG0_STRVU|nr:unnamed protein product [Strongylus vulgaris]
MNSAMFATIIFAVIRLFCHISANSEDVIRIEEKLTTDREFYDLWMHLISLQENCSHFNVLHEKLHANEINIGSLQADQLAEQSIDFPLSHASLNSCIRMPPSDAEDTADSLRPSSVAIYADLGHLTTFCKSNLSVLQAGTRTFFVVFLVFTLIFDCNRRVIADSIRQIQGYENAWKLIVIAATIQDGDASETRQTAIEVLSAVEEFHRLLPTRTFIVVVRSSGNGIWADASHSHKACHEMLARWKSYARFNSNSVWDQVEIIVQKNFRKSDFTVEILPLLRESALVNLPEQ